RTVGVGVAGTTARPTLARGADSHGARDVDHEDDAAAEGRLARSAGGAESRIAIVVGAAAATAAVRPAGSLEAFRVFGARHAEPSIADRRSFGTFAARGTIATGTAPRDAIRTLAGAMRRFAALDAAGVDA